MKPPHHRVIPAALLLAAVGTSACVPDASPRARVTNAYLRIVEAEDARPAAGPVLEFLLDATDNENVFLRAAAVRALGRLEDPALATFIERLLDDPAAPVRAAAADALAQAHWIGSGEGALSPLMERVGAETDPEVRGVLAQALGRLRLPAADRARVGRVLLEMSTVAEADAPRPTLTGVMLGLESLARTAPEVAGNLPGLESRMERLTGYQGDHWLRPENVRIRTLAISVLGQAGFMNLERAFRALRDDAPEVGGTAMRFYESVTPLARPEVMRRAVGSPSLFTVIEAFRFLEREPRDERNCRYLFAGGRVTPPDSPRPVPEPIRVLALDALSEPCPDLEGQRSLLRNVVESLDADPVHWQAPAHALVSLARIAPRDAGARLTAFTGHPNPFVRAWGARAAGILGNRAVLRSLTGDASANVRTVAVQALFALEGHGIDDLLLEQLQEDDPQLLLTTAGLLAGTPRPAAAASALLDAFDRISAAARETWRDPRVAMIDRLAEVGRAADAERLLPYLSDYDVVVAEAAAEALRGWTGQLHAATPRPLPRLPLPGLEEMQAMDGAHVILHMQGGGAIDIELHPWEATTNTYRFYRLASEGYFDGLTFHRWAPNFVIQGGSPGANEYQGDGAFTRDEVDRRSHWRGTVGISTRGHDTGDGQIFVNLMDNPRLDHTYTLVGRVVAGMDVVDQVLEGAVIERAEVVTTH